MTPGNVIETRKTILIECGWVLDFHLLVKHHMSTVTKVIRYWRLNLSRKTTRLLKVMTLFFSLAASYMLKHIQYLLLMTSLKLIAVKTIFRNE